MLIELGSARATRFFCFLKYTFRIHTCGWVIGVNHAWMEGRSVNNDGTTRVVFWDCFRSQREG